MKGQYSQIHELAKPYLDTRQNDIHVPIVYRFAERLLKIYSQADPAVVLPAVLLHDTGWKMIPEDQQVKAFGPKMQDADLRRVHEVEGMRIAREILNAVGYDPAKRDEIIAIIDGHDSRDTALSLNDKLVKDSDKLWRFTETGITIDHQRFGIALGEYMTWLGKQIDVWLFLPESKQMARASFAESQAALCCLNEKET